MTTCKPCAITRKNHRVIIESRTQSQDTYGEPTDAWTELATVFATVRPLMGHELLLAQQHESRVTHEVTINYRSDVDEAMRLIFRSRTLNIKSIINPNETNRELVLRCVEVTT